MRILYTFALITLLYGTSRVALEAASVLRTPRLRWRQLAPSTSSTTPAPAPLIPSLAKFTFSWVDPLLEVNRELTVRDLWPVVSNTSSVPGFPKGCDSIPLRHLSNATILQSYRHSSLFKDLLHRNHHSLRVAGLWKLLHTSLLFMPTFLLRNILNHRRPNDMLALFIILCSKTIAENQYFMHMTNAVVETRNFVSNLLFRKALHLPPGANITATEVIQLIQLDGHRLEHVLLSLHIVWDGLLQIFGYSFMLYRLLGSPIFIGIFMMLATIPLNSMRFTEMERQRAAMIQHASHRLRHTAELFRHAFAIKAYNWFPPFCNRILSYRRKELLCLQKATYLRSAIIALTTVTPAFMAMLTYMVYAMMGKSLNSASAFAALNVFNQMRLPLMLYPLVMNSFIDGRLGLDRIEAYLNMPTLAHRDVHTANASTPIVEIANGTFAWGSNVTLANVSLSLHPGDLLAVKGTVGSGKSSLLQAILGEIPLVSGDVKVRGKLSYAAQEYWLPHDTIRNIVLFHSAYNATRYYDVLRICGLISDLNQMPLRDQTVITDSGANLSGGQKQRLCLARALYQQADVYLLDDSLSALDNRMRRHVTRGLLLWLRDKAKVLVTSQAKALPFASSTVYLNKTVDGAGFIEQTTKGNRSHYLIDTSEQTSMEIRREDNTKSAVDLSIEDKEETSGVVAKNFLVSYSTYFKSMKSNRLVAFVGIVYIATNIAQQLQQYSMTLWLKQARHPAFIQMMCGVSLLLAFLTWSRAYLVTLLGARASENLHRQLLHRGAHSPLSYFESSKASSLLQIFAKDLEAIDQMLPFALGQATSTTLQIVSNLASNIIISPKIALILTPISAIYYMMAKSFHRVAVKLKRLEPRTKTPMVRQILSSLAGATTIRAFDKVEVVLQKGQELISDNVRVLYAQRSIERWLSMRMEMLGNVIVYATALLSLYAGDVLQGISLINAMGLTSNLYWLVRHWVDVEVLMNSVLKVNTALQLPQEETYMVDKSNGKVSDEELLQQGWISSGDISIESVTLSYANQTALRNVSVNIPAKQRVGIVGRTGSGKSSILRALLRLTELQHGSIMIDGTDICKIGLEALRSQVAIVPQHPSIVSGTVRENLDPLNKYTDSELWKALYKAHVGDVVSSLPSGLDTYCDASTFSLGQQQLLCLSRAILRQCKVVLLDEATSAMDSHSDYLIQKTIRNEFGNGKSTLITVAHRLASVMDADVIIVMDRGEVLEIDTPVNLLSNRSSYFSQLVAADA